MNGAPQPSVLLVEDEPLLAMDVEMVLNAAGFRVIGPATTTARALALVREESPDLTILDLNLGDEMAFPVLDALAKGGRVFIILSGHSHRLVPAPHRHRPYIQKPYEANALLRAVHEAMNGAWRGARLDRASGS